MPERYQQGQLASPVVGTPGLDRSAGQAELQIAQTADAMRKDQNAMAMQGLQQAEQSFNAAYSAFHQWGAEKRYNARLKTAEENEQRRLQVQFDLQDEGDRMNATLGDLKERFAADPQKAIQEYNNQVPVMRQQFMDRYQSDPKRLRMLMSAQRNAERQGLGHLQAWAKETTTANLNRRLSLMPEQVTNKINGLTGSLQDQLAGFKETLTGTNAIYDNMRMSAVSQAHHDEILTKQLGLNGAAGKDFVNHVLAQVPDGEDGIKFLDTVGSVLKDPKKFGIPLDPEDHKSFVQQVHSQRSAHEQDVITGIQGDNTITALDANKLKNSLYLAVDDPTKMTQIVRQVQTRLNDLDKQIALVSKEPDSKIKNAKLQGLKQEQSIYLSETGQEVKQQRSFEQLQRSLTSFAQSQIRFQQSQIGWAQGQQKFNQWVVDQETKTQNKAAAEATAKKVAAFNSEWSGTLKALAGAWAIPPESKQQQVVQEIITKAIPQLDKAVATGAIPASSYGGYMDQLKNQAKTAALSKSSEPLKIGPFSFGGGVKTLKGEEKIKAQQAAQAQFGQIVARQQHNFNALDTSVKELSALTTGKAEKAVLTQYLHQHMPTLLNSEGYKKLPPQQQEAIRAKTVRDMVQQFRQGQLK